MDWREWVLLGFDVLLVLLGVAWVVEKALEKRRRKKGQQEWPWWVLVAVLVVVLGASGFKIEYQVWRSNRMARVTEMVRRALDEGQIIRGQLLVDCAFNRAAEGRVEDWHTRLLKGLRDEGTALDAMFAGEPTERVTSQCPERDAAVRRVDWHLERLRQVFVALPGHLAR